jgi:hypothetical protein
MFTHLCKKNVYVLIIISSLCLVFSACFSKKEPVVSPPVKTLEELCPLPTSKLIDKAMSEARETLSNPDCLFRFNAIFAHLIKIALNDPRPENIKNFDEFLDWTVKRSIISTRQSKEIYTRYFSHKFVALPRDYQTCSSCKNLDKLLRKMNEELELKKIGLWTICKNRNKYIRAQSDYINLKTILKATCKACQAGE